MCGITVDNRDKLDDLLARGRLSAPRRERIFDEVDRRVRRSARAPSKYLLVAGPIALAAGLVMLLRPPSESSGHFAAKGSARSSFELGCSGGEISHCPRGSKLIFRLGALPSGGFLHAYAEPLERGRERIWYFPTAANLPPRVEPAAEGSILERGMVVGPEHATGLYKVHVVLASTPLSREELLASPAQNVVAADVIEMVIVEP